MFLLLTAKNIHIVGISVYTHSKSKIQIMWVAKICLFLHANELAFQCWSLLRLCQCLKWNGVSLRRTYILLNIRFITLCWVVARLFKLKFRWLKSSKLKSFRHITCPKSYSFLLVAESSSWSGRELNIQDSSTRAIMRNSICLTRSSILQSIIEYFSYSCLNENQRVVKRIVALFWMYGFTMHKLHTGDPL